MNNIQTLLSIGSIGLFSFVSLNFNSAVLQNLSVEVESKVYLTAFSLADDMIEEIKQKAFDEETITFRSINPDELTESLYLGPETGESNVTQYDDIDDYDDYVRPVSLPHAENYNVTCRVDYVSGSNPGQTSLVQTYFKRVRVTVTSPYLRNPVTLTQIFTLHSK
ncbi:MAG: hypothetical protein N3D80_05300 [Ignavibacterium album]|uniref:Uncharacterized protein n=1 Tax=Ignavibacterium album TaxID=591197 RepID=A0A7V2ZM22_9BACT|nr:hypothetical protein [Ignavibacterium album]MCX8105275.1 hypothetical protein [Ignavibacterium album]